MDLITGVTTVSNITNGSVVLTTGTLGSIANIAVVHNSGTVAALPDLPGGTLDAVTTVSNLTIGSVRMTVGTVSVLPDLPGGTIDEVTSVTTVSNITNGSVRITVGTISVLPDLPGGTVDAVTSVTTVSNLTNGSVTMTVGTVSVLPDLPGGTIDAVTNLAGGTIYNIGVGARHPDEFATVVSSGTTTLGTVKAAVSGSAIYVSSMVVSVGTASNVEIASGGTSTPILGTLFFATNGGAAMKFDPPIRTAGGSALVYKQSVAGPLSITCTGYVD